MIHLAIAILWFLIGVIILGSVVWVALYVARRVFSSMPSQVDTVAWGVFAILCLIYILMAISGGDQSFPFPRLR